MIDTLVQEKEERLLKKPLPFISHSQINRYLLCPEQYRLYYVEGLRLKIPKANLVFGQIIHQALAFQFRGQGDPVKFFANAWNDLKRVELTYSQKESWERLRASGEGLLEKFLKEEFHRIGQVNAVEKAFELDITSLDLPFVGVIDLVGEVDETNSIVDFKSAGAVYEDHEAAMSDQLTVYNLAEPEVRQLALWVLVKTKEPKIEWHPTERSPDRLAEYLLKAGYVAREIKGGHFYKRLGMWCSWCDYLPVCLGDKKKAEETLVRV